MKKFIIKAGILAVVIYFVIIVCNYTIDPANIYHDNVTKEMAQRLAEGNIVKSPDDWDEGLLLELVVSALEKSPETVILGSSHTRYIPFEFDDYYNASLSSACLGDYYAALGVFEHNQVMPDKIILGLDQWIFEVDISYVGQTSLSNYNEYEQDKILNGNAGSVLQAVGQNAIAGEVKEFFSFPYFQASFKTMLTNGIPEREQNMNIEIVADDTPADYQKQLPNGRGTMNTGAYMSLEQCVSAAQTRIDSGETPFLTRTGTLDIHKSVVKQFEAMVEYLLEKGIEVEFYLPPWPPTFYDYCVSTEAYQGVTEIEKYLRLYAKKLGIVVRGTYDPNLAGVSNEDLSDYQHLKPEIMLETYNLILE